MNALDASNVKKNATYGTAFISGPPFVGIKMELASTINANFAVKKES